MSINRYTLALFALSAASGTLTACGKKDEAMPLLPASALITAPSAALATSGPATGGGQDGSLPDTAAALATPAAAPAAKPSASSTMTQDQESKAMPLPGQVNDHSTPAPSKAEGS